MGVVNNHSGPLDKDQMAHPAEATVKRIPGVA